MIYYSHIYLFLLNLISGNATPTRQKSVSPQEFRRGIQVMKSWFHNLNDNQRTLALQNIAVSLHLLNIYLLVASIACRICLKKM